MSDNFVIGGTGTLGEAFIRKSIKQGKSVTCFSRCELKQKELETRISNSLLRCVVGDIRDLSALTRAMAGHENVFLFAALKHVDTLEYNPEEGVKTNVLGTINALDAAETCGVERFVFSSTDKAVDPINAYGYSKALAEKIILSRKRTMQSKIFRWGNVIGSRGSVIPAFVRALRKTPATVNVTDVNMSRFWIKIEDAVDFIWDTFEDQSYGDVLIPQINAAPVTQVIRAIADILGVKEYSINVVGVRPGEKIHERLESIHTGAQDSSSKFYSFLYQDLVDYLEPAIRAVK